MTRVAWKCLEGLILQMRIEIQVVFVIIVTDGNIYGDLQSRLTGLLVCSFV